MSIFIRIANASACLTLAAALVTLPGPALAQREAVAEYANYLKHKKDKGAETAVENVALRSAINRLGERVRCLELKTTPCLAKTAAAGRRR